MEILKNFGIDPMLLIAGVVNFLIILYILKKLVYKPVFNILKKRADGIKEGIAKAEESEKALKDAEAKEKKIIKEAHEKALIIIQEAKEKAVIVAKETEEKAKKQAGQMLTDAKIQIEIETKKAEQQLNLHISELSVAILKKALGNTFGDKEQTEIVTKAVKTLGNKVN